MKRLLCIFVLALALTAGGASAQSVFRDPRSVPLGNVPPPSQKALLAPQRVSIPPPGDRKGPKPPSGTRIVIPKQERSEEGQR